MASTPNFSINITFDNPETAEAFGRGLGSGGEALLALLSGSGTAAGNQRRNSARAPKALADTPAGESDKDLRTWYAGWSKRTGQVIENPETEDQAPPARGRLPKWWRENILALRAEEDAEEKVEGQETAPIDAVAVVDSEEEITEEPEQPKRRDRKFLRGGQKASA